MEDDEIFTRKPSSSDLFFQSAGDAARQAAKQISKAAIKTKDVASAAVGNLQNKLKSLKSSKKSTVLDDEYPVTFASKEKVAGKPSATRTFQTLRTSVMQHKTMLMYIFAIVFSLSFIIAGLVLMNKNAYANKPESTCDTTGDCYATTTPDGNVILTDALTIENDASPSNVGIILLLFGVACACLTLVLYFRKK